MLVSRQRLVRTILFIPGRNLVYLNNAKVACSSVKKSLWLADSPGTYSDNPHYRGAGSPFCGSLEGISKNLDVFLHSTFFTVVRNPYIRILSAYLDKIAKRPRDAAVWHPFARRYRLDDNAELSFNEFLTMVTSENPSLIDQHFAPQHINTLSALISPDFIGRLEDMGGVETFLASRGIALANHAPHVTKAKSSVGEYFGTAETEMVLSYYRKDFDLFGYSDDPALTDPVRDTAVGAEGRDVIKLLIQSYTAPNIDGRRRCIDALTKMAPDVISDYISLEAGVTHLPELKRLGDMAISGEITNWRFVSKIGQELAENDMIVEASSVMHRAQLLMYGPQPPSPV